jgi:hypothetical protein
MPKRDGSKCLISAFRFSVQFSFQRHRALNALTGQLSCQGVRLLDISHTLRRNASLLTPPVWVPAKVLAKNRTRGTQSLHLWITRQPTSHVIFLAAHVMKTKETMEVVQKLIK